MIHLLLLQAWLHVGVHSPHILKKLFISIPRFLTIKVEKVAAVAAQGSREMLSIVRVTNTALLLVIFILTLDRTVLPIEICGLDENNKKLVAVQNLDKNVESNGCSKPSFIQVLQFGSVIFIFFL